MKNFTLHPSLVYCSVYRSVRKVKNRLYFLSRDLSKQMNRAFLEKNVGKSNHIETSVPRYIETGMLVVIHRVAADLFGYENALEGPGIF